MREGLGGSPGSARSAEPPEYSVPALDKALDILELLAAEPGGLSQGAVADAVGRTVGQVFRVLQTLEARGYLLRDPRSGLYSLSMALFELATRHDPVRGLRAAALAPMRRLSDGIQQSCNLGILDSGRILVLAQVESPATFGFRVRVGAEFPVESTATGAVLVAFGDPSVRRGASAAFAERIDRVADRGFEQSDDVLQPGVTDIVFPILGSSGLAVAALTVPYVATSASTGTVRRVVEAARSAAEEISLALGSGEWARAGQPSSGPFDTGN